MTSSLLRAESGRSRPRLIRPREVALSVCSAEDACWQVLSWVFADAEAPPRRPLM